MIRRNARKKPPAEVFCGQFALLLIPIGELKIALHKYTVHVIDMGNIKAAEIKPGNGIAVIEHTGHICYLGSIEMTEIQLCQGFAGKKHAVHIRYILCIKATQVKGLQSSAI